MDSDGRNILVNPRQSKNPILQHIRNVPWSFIGNVQNKFDGNNSSSAASTSGSAATPSIIDISSASSSIDDPDFIMGSHSVCLFISLQYHMLHPSYLIKRISEVKNKCFQYKVKIILALVDVQDHFTALSRITSLATTNEFTLILSWSYEEAARYLETYKMYEKRSAEIIQGKQEKDHLPRVTDALTLIRSINKTDVKMLSQNFHDLASIMEASMEELATCNGIGEKKVLSLFKCFNEPFISKTDSAESTNDPE